VPVSLLLLLFPVCAGQANLELATDSSVDYVPVIALTLSGLGATVGTVYAGLHNIKEVKYLKFAVSMIVNSHIIFCFNQSLH